MYRTDFWSDFDSDARCTQESRRTSDLLPEKLFQALKSKL